MAKMSTFNSKESVKARKVTSADGEDVVTDRGPVHADKGFYIVEREENSYNAMTGETDTRTLTEVWEGETFEKSWRGKQTASKSTASKSKSARKTAQSRTAPSAPKTEQSAADRVKASQGGPESA